MQASVQPGPISLSSPSSLLGAQPSLSLEPWTRMKRNEQSFLVQLPALCQMFLSLWYNCHPSVIHNEL